jgi:transcriptional regulator
MYIPKHFNMDDEKKIFDHIEEYGFATLISLHNGEHCVTHLPLMLERDKKELTGHFALANSQWKDIEKHQVLVIFHGPHCYISPSWYETMDAVPTWNYTAVHVYGRVEIVKDPKEVFDSLQKMVNKYEQPTSPYKLDNVDSDYLNGLSKGIVGFKIKIDKIEGKAKLSQNHPLERRQLVIERLGKLPGEDNQKMAELMRKNI